MAAQLPGGTLGQIHQARGRGDQALSCYDALNSPGASEVRAALASELAQPSRERRPASVH